MDKLADMDEEKAEARHDLIDFINKNATNLDERMIV